MSSVGILSEGKTATFCKELMFPLEYHQESSSLILQFVDDLPILSLSTRLLTNNESREKTKNKILHYTKIKTTIKSIVSSSKYDVSRKPASLVNEEVYGQIHKNKMATDPIIHFVLEWWVEFYY